LLNRKFNTPIWRAFTYYMRLFDIDTLPADIPVTWQAPGWPWVDPLKDSRAAKTEIELGINTRRKLAADRGHDFDELVEQLKREKGQLEQAGINTRRKLAADRGHDFDELVEQLKREKGQLEQAGINNTAQEQGA
jgi:capsid protein